jgi:hydroxylamine reductase
MRLGPTMPAFLTPNVIKVLVETFDLTSITTPSQDLAAILA